MLPEMTEHALTEDLQRKQFAVQGFHVNFQIRSRKQHVSNGPANFCGGAKKEVKKFQITLVP